MRPRRQLSSSRKNEHGKPCDGAWPEEKVDVFKRWTGTGFQT